VAVDRFDTSPYRARNAAIVSDFKPKDFIAMAKLRRMNQLSRFGVSATKLALDDASWSSRTYARTDVGVAIGTAFGPVQTSLEYMEEYLAKGPSLAPPQLFAESVANAPGSHIAIEHGFEGFNITFTQRESSALTALTYAASQIVKGTVKAALVGGVDEINELTFNVLDRVKALAVAEGEQTEEMRPFDVKRNGFSMGEGGGALVLESEAAGDHCYGYLRGYAVGRDTSASVSDWGTDAAAVAAVMSRAIDDAALAPADIDAIWASANGSRNCDRLEYRAIQQLFGPAIPRVVATKGYFGEYAAGGAMHLASACLALYDGRIPATVGFETAEREMLFVPAPKERDTPLRHILVNTLSAGGGIVSAVFSRSLD
jgi:3-oxoacyl-(acyl-carrier-protein) synthase